jgi:hypothetical protein
VDFFLFLALKKELSGLTMTLKEFKIRTIMKYNFAGAFLSSWSAAKNVFESAAAMSRSLRNTFSPICFGFHFIYVLQLVFENTL